MVYAAASLTLPVHVFQVRTRTSYVDTISDPTLFAFGLFTRHASISADVSEHRHTQLCEHTPPVVHTFQHAGIW